MDELRVVLAGYGRFGRRHAEVVAHHPSARLVGIADPDAAARERAAQQHPEAAVRADPHALLRELAPDCVLIVSTEDTHAAIARAAMDLGVHVFCEKPLATELAEARDLRDLAEGRDIVYQAGYILRYEPRHVLLAHEVAAGGLGTITRLRAKRHCSLAWFQAYGTRVHPVYETLVHDIDLVVWLSGQRCRTVHAWERRFLDAPVPETVVAVLELADGAVAVVESSWLVPDGAPVNITGWGEGGGEGDGVIDADLEVIGTAASASLSTYEPSLLVTTADRTYVPDTSFWPSIGGRPGGALREELWDFFERAAGLAGTGVASIDDALHVQEIADAAVKAAATGRPVEVAP
jgi:predicted dehydrogenase